MILGTHSRQLLSVGNCTLNKEEPLNDDVDGGELSFISEYKLKKPFQVFAWLSMTTMLKTLLSARHGVHLKNVLVSTLMPQEY